MTTPYTPADLARFLNGERAQVWARHRETDESFYLSPGAADEHRAFAKTHLRCPYPDCVAPISTRGGSKRDHFFHVNGTPHESAPESEFHLAAKAMIATWARSRVPEGAVVVEERTVKDEATYVHRRADVMATGRTGRQVAYEVEYKSFAVQAWATKQSNYDGLDIACAWLLGHTRVRLAGRAEHTGEQDANPVRLPLLAVEMARTGRPLVVVNPVTRQVGTLMGDRAGTTRFSGRDGGIAWLAVDDLDDCSFEAKRGIVTPTMRTIDAHQARRAEAARAEAEETERRAASSARIVAKHERVWEASPARAALVERWGSVPAPLEWDYGNRWYFHALPVHWHSVIYEELLHGRTVGAGFKWADVFAALDRHHIVRHRDTGRVFQGVALFMEAMRDLGLVKIHRDSERRVLLFSPTGVALDVAVSRREQQQAAAQAKRVQWEQMKAEEGARKSRERQERQADLEARSTTRKVVLADGKIRYVPK